MSRTFQFLLPLLVAGIVGADAAYNNVTDGPHSCGGVDIPYPFGIIDSDGNGDFRKGFDVTCDAGKPVLVFAGDDGDGIPIPIGNFSIETAEARVWLPVSSQCYDSSGKMNDSANGDLQFNNDGVYRISKAKNYFFVLGCSTLGFLESKPRSLAGDGNITSFAQLAGCACYCEDTKSAVSGECSGIGCCHANVPPDLVDNFVKFDTSVIPVSSSISISSCDYAFLAEKDYYTFNKADLSMDVHQKMPVTLNWAIRDNLTCKQATTEKAYACRSNNSHCLDSSNGPGYICNCRRGYEGNPYIVDGCTDINECEHKNHYPCEGVCENKQGSYKCTCPKHSHSADPFTKPCSSKSFPRKALIITGFGGLLIIATIFSFLLLKDRRKMQDRFKKNGGPILEKVDNLKLFKKNEIMKFQKKKNIIGEGAFGKVYKGSIGDNNQLVAVKVSNVNSPDKEQFTNEIIIQSRLIHKNIVKLLGCCINVSIPMLVYEFVTKGSLHDMLHGANSIPLSMDQRLKIAAGSAEGLAYMHSKTATTILHGDVKPANILINDDFVPKISDFGTSRLIDTDKQEPGIIIGDTCYMDPVYFQTGVLTDKSDVYSFGVVLLELITRKKASQFDKTRLLKDFLEAYAKDKSVTKLIDKELVDFDDLELLDIFARMISECLSLEISQRPDMTELAERLHGLVNRVHGKLHGLPNDLVET